MSEKKAVNRNLVIALGIICVVLAASLTGSAVNYTMLIAAKDSQITHYQDQTASLNAQISELNSQTANLQNQVNRLNDIINSLTKIFFVQDPNFATLSSNNTLWGIEAWHPNDYSICETRNGTLHLFYNGTLNDSYGNSGVYQGTHTYGGFTHQLLIGDSPENTYYSDCAVFPRDMPSGQFWLETNLTITDTGFNLYPTVYDTSIARVNLGVTLMCALNDQPLNLTGQNLWLDIYFAGYSLNDTSAWFIPKNTNYVDNTSDIHAGYFVGEVPQQDFGKWVSMRIDLGDYISKTLDLIADKTNININTIRVYGLILFVECLGAHADIEYDYLRTSKT